MDFKDKYIEELVEVRKEARLNKDWKLSDKIRNHLDDNNVFTFDHKWGQEALYLSKEYFINKPENITNRQFVERRIKQDIRAESQFDAWLYSTQQSKI